MSEHIDPLRPGGPGKRRSEQQTGQEDGGAEGRQQSFVPRAASNAPQPPRGSATSAEAGTLGQDAAKVGRAATDIAVGLGARSRGQSAGAVNPTKRQGAGQASALGGRFAGRSATPVPPTGGATPGLQMPGRAVKPSSAPEPEGKALPKWLDSSRHSKSGAVASQLGYSKQNKAEARARNANGRAGRDDRGRMEKSLDRTAAATGVDVSQSKVLDAYFGPVGTAARGAIKAKKVVDRRVKRTKRNAVFASLVLVGISIMSVTASTGGAASDAGGSAAALGSCSVLGAVPAGNTQGGTASDVQVRNATTIIGVAKGLQLPEKAWKIALMTALQESGLRNLASNRNPGSLSIPNDGVAPGDLDSVGLFQQRDAWGSLQERMDPPTTSLFFFTGGRGGQRGLIDIQGWLQMSEGQAAQAVQVSAFPDAYDKHAANADTLIAQLRDAPTIPYTGAPLPAITDGTAIGLPGTPNGCATGSGVVQLDGTAMHVDTSGLACPAGTTDGGVQLAPGNVPTRQCAVTIAPGMTVNASIAGNTVAIITDARAAGIDLGGSGFRSNQRQIELRQINGCPDIYTAPASSCRVPTAIPGKSEHEWGLAHDFTVDGSTIGVYKGANHAAAFNWLQANAARYGYKNLPSENWHWSVDGS